MSETTKPSRTTIKATHAAIKDFHAMRKQYATQGVRHEMGVRTAFQNLLNSTAKTANWVLITEQSLKIDGKLIRPDGVLRDEFKLPRGYWEAKDTADDLNVEVKKKAGKGYPLTNTIFEDSHQAALYQGGQEILRIALDNPQQVADLLNLFYSYAEPDIENFEQAVAEFKRIVPELAKGLQDKIAAAHKDNKKFQAAYSEFFTLCQTALNPNISRDSVDEMLVQHLLTERLIRKIFDNPDFMRKNAIAAEIEKVIDALVSQSFSREEYLRTLDRFYRAIEDAAHGLQDFSDKQQFLNSVYERFFQGYSTDIADTHGIVYTPQPIVDFMCASVVEVLHSEFGKTLGDPDVVILDPCTGTGNFIVNLLRRYSKRDLEQAYRERLFANEIMLMPYYIAALNIEHAYYELTGAYEPFEGLCFVDTLDIAESQQLNMFNEANSARVERQKQAPITVIIGNPPYNVGQENENDNNKNRKYEVIDKQIRDTYAKDSNATNKNALSDAYVKFFRWAVDRLQGRDGIICFVTNNSFIDQLAFDGMRKHLLQDFTHIYHIDLHGNVRKNPKLSGTAHNVFGIQVGVGITIAVRSSVHTTRQLAYYRVPEDWRKEEKLNWLSALSSPLSAGGEGLGVGFPSSAGGEGSGVGFPSSVGGEGSGVGFSWHDNPPTLWDKIKPLARQKRHEPTEAELVLWQQLRDKQTPFKFRRQHPFGQFIVDFYCAEANLVVEVDGEIHQYTQAEDRLRQDILEEQGLRVIRFKNEQVLHDVSSVVREIVKVAQREGEGRGTPPPTPPRQRRGENSEIALLGRVQWQSLTPDQRYTWLVPENTEQFDAYLPMGSKESKRAGSKPETIFRQYARGIISCRDDVVYDFESDKLLTRMQEFIENYNAEVNRYARAGTPKNVDNFVKYDKVKWDSTLKRHLKSLRESEYSSAHLRQAIYRPFTKTNLYFDGMLLNSIHLQHYFFPTPATEQENRVIWLKVGSDWPMFALMANTIVDLLPQGGSQCFPFYTYDEDGTNRRENITDWALAQFRDHYADPSISKWDIFYYVYAILHHPTYRAKFAGNLKRDLPRIPFVDPTSSAFHAFAEAGHQLAELHLTYEQAQPYRLKWVEAKEVPLSYRVEKMRLSKDKTSLTVNDSLTLSGIPAEAFQYKLGNRSALDWIIDQYQVSTDKRSGITSDPNRNDDPRYIVDLVERIITVSLETVRIVADLPPLL